jgi:hypothetical protein
MAFPRSAEVPLRLKHAIVLLTALALIGGAWVLIRSHIRATALAGSAIDQPKPHQPIPPHRGTPVELGDEQFTIELVREPASGTLRAYILDGEMESFIRIAARQLDLEVQRPDREETLTLKPVADLATGETVGDTSLFEARADWLKSADTFKGVLKNLKIQDQVFKSVEFSFPKGNAKD